LVTQSVMCKKQSIVFCSIETTTETRKEYTIKFGINDSFQSSSSIPQLSTEEMD